MKMQCFVFLYPAEFPYPIKIDVEVQAYQKTRKPAK